MAKNELTVKRILFSGYKSFEEEQAIALGDNITALIGRNNSGKSSVMNVIEVVYDEIGHRKYRAEMSDICLQFGIQREDNYLRNNGYSDIIWRLASQCITTVTYPLEPFIDRRSLGTIRNEKKNPLLSEMDHLSSYYQGYNSNYKVYRLDSERNITAEDENKKIALEHDGSGATNLIRAVLNDSEKDEKLVEKVLLDELNKVMKPDAVFESIKIQQSDIGWEVYLTERGKARIPLSKCGSGLKTVLLVLINLHILPALNKDNKRIIFCFEELENNIHPALQRRLFDYLFEYASKTNHSVVLTTHSHVAINAFWGKEKVKLYHIIKDENSRIIPIDNYLAKAELLNDLDVRASDILQSNGIIWVEGPSDRIYIKKWIDLYSDVPLIEDKDYQFLYYGGRLLSHYSASEESSIKGLISILTTNRNSVIVIDSDKRNRSSRINETKKRVQAEFEKLDLFVWITKGKEIENYLSSEVVNSINDTELPQIGQYELFPLYVAESDNNFSSHKVDYAVKATSYMNKDNSFKVLDLEKQIGELCQRIKCWNRKEDELI